MKLLTLEQVLILHKQIIEQSGGSLGIRDKGILESALAQPYTRLSSFFCLTKSKLHYLK